MADWLDIANALADREQANAKFQKLIRERDEALERVAELESALVTTTEERVKLLKGDANIVARNLDEKLKSCRELSTERADELEKWHKWFKQKFPDTKGKPWE